MPEASIFLSAFVSVSVGAGLFKNSSLDNIWAWRLFSWSVTLKSWWCGGKVWGWGRTVYNFRIKSVFSGLVPPGCDLHNCFLASLLLGLLSPWYSFPPPARAMRGFIWGQEGPSPWEPSGIPRCKTHKSVSPILRLQPQEFLILRLGPHLASNHLSITTIEVLYKFMTPAAPVHHK